MNTNQLQYNIENELFPIFLLFFTIIAFLKIAYPNHLMEYLKLPFNNKYIIIYEKKERKLHLFTVIMFVLQWISLSFIAYFLLRNYNINYLIISGFMWIDVTITMFFLLLLKIFIQLFISTLFDLQSFYKSYFFTKVSYSNYASVLIVLYLFCIVYTSKITELHLFLSLLILLIINVLSWITIIKIHQNSIKTYIIYFILYLCTLEIAPYIFLTYGSRFLQK